jgi:hypothetical protein
MESINDISVKARKITDVCVTQCILIENLEKSAEKDKIQI